MMLYEQNYINELEIAIGKVYQFDSYNIFKNINSIQDLKDYAFNLKNRGILPSYYNEIISNASDEYIISAASLCNNPDIVAFSKKCKDFDKYKDYVANLFDTLNYGELYHFICANYQFIKNDIERLLSDSTFSPCIITQVLFYTPELMKKNHNRIIEALYFLCNIEMNAVTQSGFKSWKLKNALLSYDEETEKTKIIKQPTLHRYDSMIKITNFWFCHDVGDSYNPYFLNFFDKIINEIENGKRNGKVAEINVFKDPFYSELESAIDKIANYDKKVDISKMDISTFKKYVMNIDYIGEGKIPESVCPTILSTPDKTLQAAIINYLVKENKNHCNTQEIRKAEEKPYKNSWRKDIREDLDYIYEYLANHQNESSKINRINSFFVPEYENLLKHYAEAERSNNTTVVSALKNEINSFEKVFKSYLTQTIKALFIEEQAQAKVSTKVAEQLLQMDFGNCEAEDIELE